MVNSARHSCLSLVFVSLLIPGQHCVWFTRDLATFGSTEGAVTAMSQVPALVTQWPGAREPGHHFSVSVEPSTRVRAGHGGVREWVAGP